jgi:EAL domain-containing protein (putative c-di-GMP-specific phosphodiesterase class I)
LILREEDHIARLGGDEFAILLRSDNTDISSLAERLLKALKLPIIDSEYELNISASIGIAMLGLDTDNLSDLMRYADMALYKSKENGRNSYHYFSEELEARAIKKNKMLKDLVIAIEADQLELFYQTQHDINDKRIIGVEALIRWPKPQGGFVFPDEFIPLAEESGLIIPLGEWIISRACHDGKVLNQLAGPLTIAINLSTRQFDDPELLDKIIDSCHFNDLAHNLIELEVTESLLLNDMDMGVKILDDMRKQGFNIALDDFGTGYSSLFYLKNLPVTCIKIDKSFTAGLPGEDKDAAIVEATIRLAHSLNLDVVAEGIETEEQLAYLQQCRCDISQGYLLGKPQPLDMLVKRLEQKSNYA